MILKDHPRLRGEKFQREEYVFACLGSPPLTRGKAKKKIYAEEIAGITPAYAGKSLKLMTQANII